MKGDKVLFSCKSDEWRTPENILDYLNNQGYKIVFDCAASEENKICDNFKNDFFDGSWEMCFSCSDDRQVAYCNPPYSQCYKFVKIIAESEFRCIMLLPARTDTKWFHEYIYNKKNIRIEFIKGRLKFSGSKNSAPFPSMLVYIRC